MTLQIVLLLCISCLPFSSELLGTHTGNGFAVMFYAGSVTVTGIVQLAIWLYAAHRHRLIDRELSPVARGLQSSFREVAERTLRHALTKDLSHLEEADRAAVEKLANSMVKRMVQVPLRGLRKAAWNHSSAVIGNFLLGLEGEEPNGDGGGS